MIPVVGDLGDDGEQHFSDRREARIGEHVDQRWAGRPEAPGVIQGRAPEFRVLGVPKSLVALMFGFGFEREVRFDQSEPGGRRRELFDEGGGVVEVVEQPEAQHHLKPAEVGW